MFELKNYRGVMCFETHNSFKEKLSGGLKNNIRNLVNFHADYYRSESLHFYGIVYS